jgi:hypothetical protein
VKTEENQEILCRDGALTSSELSGKQNIMTIKKLKLFITENTLLFYYNDQPVNAA